MKGCLHIYICLAEYVYIYMCVYVTIYMCIYIYIYVYVHTHTQPASMGFLEGFQGAYRAYGFYSKRQLYIR